MLQFFFLFLLLPSILHAEIFSYTDEQGKTHYVSALDKIPARYHSNIRSEADLPPIGKVSGFKGTPQESPGIKQRVKILVAPWCGFCSMLEEYLIKQGIPFSKYDITKSSRGKSLYEKHGAGGVPISIIGKETIRGFKPDAIKAAAGY